MNRIRNYFGLVLAMLILAGVLNCGWLSDKVEKKVNEKIDQKLDEQMKKIDSSFSKEQLDSLRMLIDSVKSKQDKPVRK